MITQNSWYIKKLSYSRFHLIRPPPWSHSCYRQLSHNLGGKLTGGRLSEIDCILSVIRQNTQAINVVHYIT